MPQTACHAHSKAHPHELFGIRYVENAGRFGRSRD